MRANCGEQLRLLDTVAATSSAVAPQDSASTTITVDYAASDPGASPSGLGEVQLWAKVPNELGYSEVASYTAPLVHGSFSYAAFAGDGTYSFYTVAVDKAGNAEDAKHNSPGTRFINRCATPNEVVSRAAALDGVAGALVALPDGLMVASRLASDVNGETLAAFLPQILG